MSTATATVDVLTAEVRVLMVGSRQVTVSVAKQLDEVPLVELTIFGRVNIERGGADRWVIGADKRGNLSIAQYTEPLRYHEVLKLKCSREEFEAWEAYAVQYEQADAAPLIVLAGLK